MTSPRKIKANRANARASTGPKTAPGRARTARNGLRHGLSVPVVSDPVLSDQVEALARAIAGPAAGAALLELARQMAEAEIDLRRVREARASAPQPCLARPRLRVGRAGTRKGCTGFALFAARRSSDADAVPGRCISGIEAGGTGQAGHDPGGPGPSMAGHGAVRTARALAAQVCDPNLRYKLQDIVGAI